MNHYEVLGVSPYASTDEIRASFRRLALRYHPDIYKAPDATRQFQRINEAYQALLKERLGKAEWYDVFGLVTLQDYFDAFGYVYGSREYIKRHAGRAYDEWLERQMRREQKRKKRKG